MKSKNVEILNAAFTPMNADGSVNYDRIPQLFEHTIRTGAHGVFLNGTTGECMSLSVDERCKLVEKWVACCTQAQKRNFKVVVHVGSCNLREATRMAEHAQHLGVDGISMVPTFYFRPATVSELVRQCASIAEAAPDTDFFYYNIPSLTGVSFPMIQFMELAVKKIPSFAGIKNSHSDIVDYQHCLHFAGDRHKLYWGMDETFLMVYAAGNRHYVGSTYNYMSSLYHKMLHAVGAGDDARSQHLQREADAIYRVILSYHGVAAGKQIMSYVGVDCGPVREPLLSISGDESDALLERLKTTTFFQHAENSKHIEIDMHQ